MKIVWKYPDLRYQIEETNRLARREGFTELFEVQALGPSLKGMNNPGPSIPPDLHRTHERSAINYAMQQQLAAIQAQAASSAAQYQQHANSLQLSLAQHLQLQNHAYLLSHPQLLPSLSLFDPYYQLPWNQYKKKVPK